jgi:glycosyltransferase involved in cell wall biosynthesis
MIVTEKYDRVFVHMAPVWYALGFWWWMIRRVPTYLWYTHYKMQAGVWLFKLFGKRFFCATPQSLPQYNNSPKKTVVGHGIDLHFWTQKNNSAENPHRLLVVHRLSRSKRLELSIKALLHLDPAYTLDVYGIEAEEDYTAELKDLVRSLSLGTRVTFHGSVPSAELPIIYARHRFLLNMASETIDKTMLEAMTCGCYPVTTKGNADAIGIPLAPLIETPEAIAEFIQQYRDHAPIDAPAMYRIVQERHSLQRLVATMGEYIRSGR